MRLSVSGAPAACTTALPSWGKTLQVALRQQSQYRLFAVYLADGLGCLVLLAPLRARDAGSCCSRAARRHQPRGASQQLRVPARPHGPRQPRCEQAAVGESGGVCPAWQMHSILTWSGHTAPQRSTHKRSEADSLPKGAHSAVKVPAASSGGSQGPQCSSREARHASRKKGPSSFLAGEETPVKVSTDPRASYAIRDSLQERCGDEGSPHHASWLCSSAHSPLAACASAAFFRQ